MRRFLSEVERLLMREHPRSIPLAVLLFLGGCYTIVVGLFYTEGIAETLMTLMFLIGGLMEFAMAALFALPTHRRRAAMWLKITVILLAVPEISLGIAVFLAIP